MLAGSGAVVADAVGPTATGLLIGAALGEGDGETVAGPQADRTANTPAMARVATVEARNGCGGRESIRGIVAWAV